ncbi:BA75_00689T0 [Komagataella pastoris]|uniref:BA75_00689T0 n=1 Tax=Komagataella pastoris TaxID=4922 RepID=A0A1B2J9R1_PICPA|nr:BA75_00689T0 [Komagataella pastoris]
MDIALEILDTFVFDKVYAKLLPVSLVQHLPDGYLKTLGHLTGANNTVESLFGIAPNVDQASTNHWLRTVNDSIALSRPGERQVYGINAPLHFFDETAYTYASLLGRSNIIRQFTTLMVLMVVFGWGLYLSVASFSYYFVFDKAIFNHPRYLKNQMSQEIHQALTAIPTMVLLTVPWFLLELRGYSKLYFDVNESTGGWKAIIWQIPCFIMFTDCCIYFIHRWLHWPSVYKRLHKPHHKWIVCTPFASHAFHPVDGYAQSLPYHLYGMFFPLHKVSYLILFGLVNFWTVMIHDGEYLSRDPIVNGAACHTVHHLYFNYNYGQFTTLWDRLGGSYRMPDKELFDKNKKKDVKTWRSQVKQADVIREDLEGKEDFREYGTEEKLKST